MAADIDLPGEHRQEPSESNESSSLMGSLAWNPVVQTLGIMTVVSFVAWGINPVQVPRMFVLSTPMGVPPQEVLLAIYAHANPNHLISNAIWILFAGGIVSLSSSTLRFHAFFILTGIASSVAQVAVSAQFGGPAAVLGSSGSGFALVGYLLISNPVSVPIFDQLDTRYVVAVFLIGGMVFTVFYSAAGSAVLSHFVGLLLGMVAGRFRLLRVD
jgi:membrane associated rhomboid family serine protease